MGQTFPLVCSKKATGLVALRLWVAKHLYLLASSLSLFLIFLGISQF